MATEHSKNPVEKIRQLKSFVPTTVFYFSFMIFVEYNDNSLPLWGHVVAKILPIVILIRFVLRQHVGSFSSMWSCSFCRFIFLGLSFSLLGDTLLVYQNVSNTYFMAGLISFGIGHALYVLAFGWTPFSLHVLVTFSVMGGATYWYLWQGGLHAQPISLKIGAAVYIVLNGGMNWRSWARLSFQDFQDGRWYEFLGCIGAINFLISDAILAINKFVFPLPYEDYLIMGTYYTAQLGITLSVVDGPDKYLDDDEKDKK